MSDGDTQHWPDRSKHLNRRSWLQFSTRSLLAVTALTALPFVWFRRRLSAARAQAEAVERLEALGASIGYEHEWDHATDRRSTSPPPGPIWLRAVLGDHFFFTPDLILLTQFKGDQNDLAVIKHLTEVRNLGIVDSVVDDRLIPFITPLRRLEYVSLYGTQITNIGLTRLASLANLRSVVVTNTHVTEQGIERFKSLRRTCHVYSTDDD